jgi:hypothetical protein
MANDRMFMLTAVIRAGVAWLSLEKLEIDARSRQRQARPTTLHRNQNIVASSL